MLHRAEGNVMPVLKPSAKRMNMGVEVNLEACLTWALDTDEWPVSHPGRFNSDVKAHRTHWMFRLKRARPEDSMDSVEKKILSP
jgi:hypothetical protein